MGTELGKTYIYSFIYYIILLNIVLVFFSRPKFLERFSFNYGSKKIRAIFGILLFLSSFLIGSITYVIRYYNGIILI
ncbi:hypothetical protein A9Q84_04660 [Halobacteriovorax marinus]|uniref:DUF1146 domain-containing protein n=1 Tax=Halobacteriovorax marinus TaxID=97084 RepID=A0A1Y5FAJ0_9BACT|nr:hypothetical protein A9Q84_04660 [Halobacteriovorax marinus]